MLDDLPSIDCTHGTVAYAELSPGMHTLKVAATDLVGNVGITSYGFVMDLGPGLLVWFGHDGENTTVAAMEGNAAHESAAIHFTRPLRIFGYEGGNVSQTEKLAALKAIQDRLTALGKHSTYTAFTSDHASLTGADVVVLFDQQNPTGMSTVGYLMQTSLRSFLTAGGVVITLDGRAADGVTSSNMITLLSSAKLLSGIPSPSAIATGTKCGPTAAGLNDPISSVGAYAAPTNTVTVLLDASETTAIQLVTAGAGRPVVIEKFF
jgi:hypothetical protein